ncbi:MAG: zinc-binding alcohol dehydrogenase family protein, partial [Candidatus Dadabacteria bacterium]
MKAMVLEEQQPIEHSPLKLKEVNTPSLENGEILVKVLTCGVCRTDLHVIEGELKNPKLPLIVGHQVVGEVISKCNTETFKIGDRVGIAWLNQTCGRCRWCREGSENLCPQSLYTGYHKDGGYAEFIKINSSYAYKLWAEADPIKLAPLLCAGIIGYRALKRSRAQKGDKLAIYGFGSSAHITLQIARAMNIKVFVVTRAKAHRELALKLGAEWAGSIDDKLPVKVNSSIIFAPAGELVPYALKHLDKGGTLSLAGIYMSDIPSMQYEECKKKKKTVTSTEANTR